MNLLSNLIKKKILLTYDGLDQKYLKKLKIIQKELLDLPISKDQKIDKTIKGLFYNYLILPHFSKFFIFFSAIKVSIIFPLPYSYLIFLKQKGIKINIIASLIFFYVYVVIISSKKVFFSIFHNLSLKESKFTENSINIYFPKISDKSKIPSKENHLSEFTFVESCIKALNFRPTNVYHSNRNLDKFRIHDIEYNYGFPIKGLSFFNKIILFYFSFFSYLFYLITLFLNWRNLYLLDQYIDKYFFKLSDNNQKNNFQNHIIFDLQDHLLRPYWTYFADEKKYQFHLINSASGFYGFKDEFNEYPVDTMYHHLAMWNNYYVDSSIFFEYIKKIIPTTILLNDKISPFHQFENINFNFKEKLKVAIFDVVPHNLYSRAFMLPEDRYRISSTCISFLNDILKCFDEKDVILYLKSKHSLSSSKYPKTYINFFNNIKQNNVIKINPRFSPKLLSSNVHFSISCPFTTAAFYKTMTENNFFYDPINKIKNDDRGKQDLELICGYKNLNLYIESILKKIKIT